MADFKIKPSAGTGNKLILESQDGTDVLTTSDSGVAILAPTIASMANCTFPAGHIVQIRNFQTSAVATGTGLIPKDDTIPQNGEGNEWMTLAITPTSATNKLLIQAVVNIGNSASQHNPVALFQDSTAGALAVSLGHKPDVYGNAVILNHYMTAGTTSSTTFKIRSGMGSTGTTTFNGMETNRQFGGKMASSITIFEHMPH